jgi:galactokinase
VKSAAALLDQLERVGLRQPRARAIARLHELVASSLPRGGPAGREQAAWFVPGRIEVLGKHTDYCGGRSLLCATERGFVVAVVPRLDSRVLVLDAASGESCAFDLREPPLPAGEALAWRTYPAAVVRRLARNFPLAVRGADIAFASDLPPASGLSSSSALVVAVALALLHAADLEADDTYAASVGTPEDLAGYLATMENGAAFGPLEGEPGVGTFGGSQDHTAILCCRAGTLSQYGFSPTRLEATVSMPRGHTFVVGVSGVAAEKTGTARDAYNRASLAATAVLGLWNLAEGRADPTLAAACASRGDAVARAHAAIDAAPSPPFPAPFLHDRLAQFVSESLEIIPAATDALRRGDLAGFGALVDRSQAAAERGLDNQIPETTALSRMAREEGAVAASAFGAGFGGSVWALVTDEHAGSFATRWRERCLARFPDRTPAFFATGAAPGATRL